MRRNTYWSIVFLGLTAMASAKDLPMNEALILKQVAIDYSLSDQEYKLLKTIRLVEQGEPGYEMGVRPARARRFKGDHLKSLKLQAQWAAGTVRKRYNGDLRKFAHRWCPENEDHWYNMAKQYMEKE